MSSFSSDVKTLIKMNFPLYFLQDLLMSLRSKRKTLQCFHNLGLIQNVCLIYWWDLFPVSQIRYFLFHRRISSVGRELDCSEGGRGFYSQGRTNTQGLKTTEK